MAFKTLHTEIGDLCLVLAPGMDVPKGEGPIDVNPEGNGAVIPSYETDVEDWRDKEESAGGGGGAPPQQEPPKDQKKEKGEKSEEDDEPDNSLPGLSGDAGDDDDEEGETGDDETDDLIKKYTDSGAKEQDDNRNQTLGDFEDSDHVGKDLLDKAVERVHTNPVTRHECHHPGYDPNKKKKHTTLHGFGPGKELAQTGYRRFQSNKWKDMVRKWFKSRPISVKLDTWVKSDTKMISPMRQLSRMTGHNVLLPARKQPFKKNVVSKTTIFVDVSGSVWCRGVQFDFASIVKSVPRDIAEIWIFTFDGGLQQGPMRPWNYSPSQGGGGTEPWGFIAALLEKSMWRDMDGYMMLTDGQFAAPPPGLIRDPSKWCFVLTSETKGGTADSIPQGATIVPTYIEDPDWIIAQNEKGAAKDPFKKVITKK